MIRITFGILICTFIFKLKYCCLKLLYLGACLYTLAYLVESYASCNSFIDDMQYAWVESIFYLWLVDIEAVIQDKLCPSHSATITTNNTIRTKPHYRSKCLPVVCTYSNNWFICSFVLFPPSNNNNIIVTCLYLCIYTELNLELLLKFILSPNVAPPSFDALNTTSPSPFAVWLVHHVI